MKIYVAASGLEDPKAAKIEEILGYTQLQTMGPLPRFLKSACHERLGNGADVPSREDHKTFVLGILDEAAEGMPKTEEEFGAQFGLRPCVLHDTDEDAEFLVAESEIDPEEQDDEEEEAPEDDEE